MTFYEDLADGVLAKIVDILQDEGWQGLPGASVQPILIRAFNVAAKPAEDERDAANADRAQRDLNMLGQLEAMREDLARVQTERAELIDLHNLALVPLTERAEEAEAERDDLSGRVELLQEQVGEGWIDTDDHRPMHERLAAAIAERDAALKAAQDERNEHGAFLVKNDELIAQVIARATKAEAERDEAQKAADPLHTALVLAREELAGIEAREAALDEAWTRVKENHDLIIQGPRGFWGFTDEASQRHGPFDTIAEAIRACRRYCEALG